MYNKTIYPNMLKTKITAIILCMCVCISTTAQTKGEANAYLKELEELDMFKYGNNTLYYWLDENSFGLTTHMDNASVFEFILDHKDLQKKTLRNSISNNKTWWDAARACIICNKKFVFCYENIDSKRENGLCNIVFSVLELKEITNYPYGEFGEKQ